MTEHIDLVLEKLYDIKNKPVRKSPFIQLIIDYAYVIYNRGGFK